MCIRQQAACSGRHALPTLVHRSAAHAAGLSVPMPETNQSPTPDLVLVGLGNPGPDYAQPRHNLGWACLETFAHRAGIELSRRRWRSRVGSGDVAGHRLWLLEPQTFMNLSGRAVFEALRDLGLGPEEDWVVYDEMDLPLCRLRIRPVAPPSRPTSITHLLPP